MNLTQRGEQPMPKEAHKVVVIGHRNPDTDSICSAIAYAELKNRTSTLICEPRRAGKMNQAPLWRRRRHRQDLRDRL